ncbi:sugar transferase [Patescibacteria group bacterium]|nr:sugar transferase [Patescibacteria group bacterium]
MNLKIRQFILFIGDIALLYASLFLALSIRNQAIISKGIWSNHWPTFTIAFVLWIIVFYITGSYSINNIRNDLKSFIDAGRAMGINILLAVSVFYVLPQTQLSPKTILLITGIIYFILFIIWRSIIYKPISAKAFKRRVLVIGNNETVKEITEILDHNPQYGYEMAAVLSHDPHDQIGNLPDYNDPEALEKIIKKHKISIIVMDKKSRASNKLINNLYQHLDKKLEFTSLSEFYENITQRIPLEDINQFWFLENLQEGKKNFYDIVKRASDIIVSVIGLTAFLIIWPIIAAMIAIISKGPVFFIQTRLGKNGKQFRAIKFRTMVVHKEKNGPQMATKNDSRITPIGVFLRKTRLDEIPQLINILKGEMSFVGPRPERPEFVKELERAIPFYRQRLLVKPGLTGWDQISGEYHSASQADSLKKLQYDLFYIKNRSTVLDLGIILKTIRTVLMFAGR